MSLHPLLRGTLSAGSRAWAASQLFRLLQRPGVTEVEQIEDACIPPPHPWGISVEGREKAATWHFKAWCAGERQFGGPPPSAYTRRGRPLGPASVADAPSAAPGCEEGEGAESSRGGAGRLGRVGAAGGAIGAPVRRFGRPPGGPAPRRRPGRGGGCLGGWRTRQWRPGRAAERWVERRGRRRRSSSFSENYTFWVECGGLPVLPAGRWARGCQAGGRKPPPRRRVGPPAGYLVGRPPTSQHSLSIHRCLTEGSCFLHSSPHTLIQCTGKASEGGNRQGLLYLYTISTVIQRGRESRVSRGTVSTLRVRATSSELELGNPTS